MIQDATDFDARLAARSLLHHGVAAVDDIGRGLHDVLFDEVLEKLGHAADDLKTKTDCFETGWGPVYTIRDASRITKAQVKQLVLTLRPAQQSTPKA